MHIMFNCADRQRDVNNASLMTLKADAVFYDSEDRAMVIVQGEYSYATPMTQERYQDAARQLFVDAKSFEYVDLSGLPWTFVETPYEEEDTYDPESVKEWREYRAALENLRSFRR